MPATSDLLSEIDALVRAAFQPHEPGAAVIAIKNGQPVLRAGYGLANLELGVAIAPDTVFRLASITKQFTAVATLMLVEQGLLALDDPITRFWPDYPTHAHTITVEHLLTHTSGIRSYTDMPEWPPLWRKDFAVQELIDFFKYQPMQFAPGTRWAYNNSGYHQLGAIIEQVSGLSYEQFIQQRIFDPLGMRQSYYDNPARIIPKRASGYQRGADGFQNAEYLSMTQPYAAGALASTIDDLAIWDAALANGRLLQPATLERAWAPYRLADGTLTDYGYGWQLSAWQGRRTIEHSGGIHGFATYALRMPTEGAFVAALSNNPGTVSLELLALKIAALLIGQPYRDPTPIELTADELAPYIGVYRGTAGIESTIVAEDDRLLLQEPGGPPMALVPVARDEFHLEGRPLDRFVFMRGTDTYATALEWRGRSGKSERSERVDAPA
jgi:D-alanyl-D-alanine carboxypeptidase